ncbi:hypothetical protein P353_16330 [Comamonas testosteroni]|uniref:Uncharacterized protein n=1 Tax=Comamonas testosteroni TaxID=285 RepID=A0A096FEM2_COMTE|nr:hypothetical protein P353_16330 [Comamonas testosteroni]
MKASRNICNWLFSCPCKHLAKAPGSASLRLQTAGRHLALIGE